MLSSITLSHLKLLHLYTPHFIKATIWGGFAGIGASFVVADVLLIFIKDNRLHKFLLLR